MKRLRFLTPFMVLLLSVGGTFATSMTLHKATSQQWFFNGSSSSDYNDQTKYQEEPLEGVECGGDGIVCSIMAEPDPATSNQLPLLDPEEDVTETNPIYSPTLRDE